MLCEFSLLVTFKLKAARPHFKSPGQDIDRPALGHDTEALHSIARGGIVLLKLQGISTLLRSPSLRMVRGESGSKAFPDTIFSSAKSRLSMLLPNW